MFTPPCLLLVSPDRHFEPPSSFTLAPCAAIYLRPYLPTAFGFVFLFHHDQVAASGLPLLPKPSSSQTLCAERPTTLLSPRRHAVLPYSLRVETEATRGMTKIVRFALLVLEALQIRRARASLRRRLNSVTPIPTSLPHSRPAMPRILSPLEDVSRARRFPRCLEMTRRPPLTPCCLLIRLPV